MNYEERWNPVAGYEASYEVSTLGRVRRIAPQQGTRPGLILKLTPVSKRGGYLTVGLSEVGRIKKRYRVHRLVAEAFLGPSEGRLVRHLDGDPTNNRLSNLQWGDASENAFDRVRHGRNSTTNQNSEKTHCKRGHEFSPENTITRLSRNGRPSRKCRTCNNEYRQTKRASDQRALPA